MSEQSSSLPFACWVFLFFAIESASVVSGIYIGFDKCAGIGCHIGVLLVSIFTGSFILFVIIPLLLSSSFFDFILGEALLRDVIPNCFLCIGCCVKACDGGD